MAIYSPWYKQREPESVIIEILELAKKTVPQLYMAQVWVPCQQCQCVNINTNLCCMEFVYHVISENEQVNTDSCWDGRKYFSEASEFHKLQIDIRSCHSNLCDLTISKNPLAHYAQRARMSRSFAVSLEDINNSSHLYVIQFFLQPNNSKDYSQQQLLRIMAMKLKGFKFVVDYEKPNAIRCGLNVMESYEENFSESEFTTYLDIVSASCCQRPYEDYKTWVFCYPARGRLLIKEKMKKFMKSLELEEDYYWMVQFWKARMEKDRCYLQTLEQPFALGRLAKGLASYRKKCMRHQYFVDDQSKEEELPPPARVFRNRHHEISPDHLFPYTTNEFSITNYAVDCGSKGGYLALPVFDDEHNHKYVGVLEFLGFHYDQLQLIKYRLKKAQLRCTYTDNTIYGPDYMLHLDQTIYGRKKALIEIDKALKLYRVDWIHVQTGKETVLGMVLASENKSCFCHYECAV